MRKHLITLALILALTAVLIPSAAAQDGDPEPEEMADSNNAYVRFAHFAQGVDASDIYLIRKPATWRPLSWRLSDGAPLRRHQQCSPGPAGGTM